MFCFLLKKLASVKGNHQQAFNHRSFRRQSRSVSLAYRVASRALVSSRITTTRSTIRRSIAGSRDAISSRLSRSRSHRIFARSLAFRLAAFIRLIVRHLFISAHRFGCVAGCCISFPPRRRLHPSEDPHAFLEAEHPVLPCAQFALASSARCSSRGSSGARVRRALDWLARAEVPSFRAAKWCLCVLRSCCRLCCSTTSATAPIVTVELFTGIHTRSKLRKIQIASLPATPVFQHGQRFNSL